MTRKEYRQKSKARIDAYNKQYWAKNKQKLSEYHHSYYQLNKEERKAKARARNARIKDHLKEYNKSYKTKHKEEVRKHRLTHCHLYNARAWWRHTYEYEQWRHSVYERDNHTCRECNKSHCKVEAHHIKPAKDYPELIYDINNGITLCVECHKQKKRDSSGRATSL